MNIQLRLAYSSQEQVRELFREYTDMLLATDPVFARYLKLQNYQSELEHLEERYGLPNGRLYLAEADGKPAGCVALRKLDDRRCELKRLYVRPEFRGQRLGEQLVRRVICDARQIGYECMLLDTLPCLRSAVALYRALGFQDTACYNNSPVDDTLFMRLKLTK